jgi:hypothetical protein
MEYKARQEGRLQSTVFLEISPEVLHFDGVLYTNEVANKSGVEAMDVEAASEACDWEVIYQKTDWKDPAIQERRQLAKKYEVLVPTEIPVQLIKGGLK